MSKRERDRAYVTDRRNFIKWSVAAGAALGLPRWKVFEVIEKRGGVALAQQAACLATNRSVHISAGFGGFAWFQLLWPHNAVAAANNPGFAFHAPGQSVLAPGTDKPLTFAPQTPWQKLAGARQVTALMAGSNETHQDFPVTSARIAGNGDSVFAVATALQSTNATMIPAIAVNGVSLGTAPGAPQPSSVANGADIVGLFNSAASRAGGALEKTADAQLYAASYAALQTLHAAAGRSTVERAFTTGRSAADFLGTNLSAKLEISNADLTRYGVDAGTADVFRRLAETLIVTAKTFKIGLTSCVAISAFRDDPHGAFVDPAGLAKKVATLGTMLDAFLADLDVPDASCAGSTLADNLVISIHGDTPKHPLIPDNWDDSTPQNSNWVYILGAGHLRSGWFGGIDAAGGVRGWDTITGNENNASSASLASPACAAIAYAIAKGDMRRVRDFYSGPDITGVIRPNQM